MCSFVWQVFDQELVVFFNRDESVMRPKAEPPQIFKDQQTGFIMPKDPQGQGSWIAANSRGFVFVLLNDYQGALKHGEDLVSRGLLIRTLANCTSWSEINYTMEQWPLSTSQPFKLGALTTERQQHWQYDGRLSKLQAERLPHALFSSGHPKVNDIIEKRNHLLAGTTIENKQQLLNIFKGHYPQDLAGGAGKGDSYSFCMHRDDARIQS